MRLIREKAFGETKVALLDDKDHLKQVFVWRDSRLNYGETIFGKVACFMPVLKGYFVETVKGKIVFVATKKKLSQGERVLVQITKEARQGKEASGILAEKETPVLFEERLEQGFKVSIQDDWDSYSLDETLEEALSPSFEISEKVRIHIERTQMCWTIDVDSGGSSLSLSDVNKMAIRMIKDQIILKNLSGIILIDFAGRKPFFEQKELKQGMQSTLSTDDRSQVCGFTSLRLLEMKRKRTTSSLWDLFLTENGFLNAETVAFRIQKALRKSRISVPCITAHPSVLSLLKDRLGSFCQLKSGFYEKPDCFDIKAGG